MPRWLAILAFLPSLLHGAQVLQNPGFEAPYLPVTPAKPPAEITGAMAEHWGDNSNWADVTVDYGEERVNPHGGQSCQRVDARAIRGGGIQFAQAVTLTKDRTYAASVWLRGGPGTVQLLIRKGPAPYTGYASESLGLTDAWQRVALSFTAKEDAPAMFFLIPAGPCRFYVDDASFEDVTDAVSDAPSRTGNLLPDASFEAGLGAGWSVRIRSVGEPTVAARMEYADPQPAIDETTAAVGKRSVRVTVPAGGAFLLSSPRVAYHYGRVHTVSFWAKAAREGTVLDVEMEGSTLHAGVKVGTEWKRLTLSGKLPYGTTSRLWVRCWTGDTTVWLDGVALEEAAQASPAYLPAAPVEMTLRVGRPGGVFFDGEPAVIGVTTAGTVPAGARLRLGLTSVLGDRSDLPDVKLPADRVTIAPPAGHPRGLWRLRAQVVDAQGQALSTPVDQVYARLPRPREMDPDRSYFGVHIPLAPAYIAICRAIGARWTRIHDSSGITKWPMTEPERDHFQFYDQAVDATRAGGMRILGMLDGAPAWTSSKPRATTGYYATYNHPDLPDLDARWTNYVKTVVGHYRGRIDAWEVWNEPWGSGFTPGSDELYARLLKLAYPAAKEANPTSLVLGPDTYRGSKFTATVLGLSGLAFDVFSFHDYNGSLYGGPRPPAQQEVEEFTRLQQACGAPKPYWNSEGGPGELGSFYSDPPTGFGPSAQLAHVVRYDVTMMAAGVQKFFYYTLHADPPSEGVVFAGLEHDRTIRPVMAARAVLASLVDGATCLGRTEPTPGVDSYGFRQTDGTLVTVLWSYDGAPHTITPPAGARVLDVLGNPVDGVVTVTALPVYAVGR